MEGTEHLAISQLGPGDAAGGLLLSTEAHWNQNEADWRFFLGKGIVFGVRDRRDTLVATAALLPYTESDAWISMVLVTASWRRRGLATRLVDTCLTTAGKLGLTTWLDATPAGADGLWSARIHPDDPVAAAAACECTRLGRRAAFHTAGSTNSSTGDISAMGFDRGDLLRELSGRAALAALSNGDAMALVRDGRTARHIGPLFADTPAHALRLVHDIAASETGPLLIDAVATQDTISRQGLTNGGWTVERPFQRMRFGRAKSQADEPPFAVAGPEFG